LGRGGEPTAQNPSKVRRLLQVSSSKNRDFLERGSMRCVVLMQSSAACYSFCAVQVLAPCLLPSNSRRFACSVCMSKRARTCSSPQREILTGPVRGVVEVKQRYQPVFWCSFRLRSATSASVVLPKRVPTSMPDIAWPPGGPRHIPRLQHINVLKAWKYFRAQSQAPYPEVGMVHSSAP